MLRSVLGAATAAAILAMMSGGAAAQSPGAAPIGEYHQRYARDANPYERSPHTGDIVEQALAGATAAPDAFVIQEEIVLSPLPLAIPDPAPAAGPASAAGLTPGAPLGSSAFTDRKVTAGEALR